MTFHLEGYESLRHYVKEAKAIKERTLTHSVMTKKRKRNVKAIYDLRKRKNEIRWELQKVYLVPRRHVNRITKLVDLIALRDKLKKET